MDEIAEQGFAAHWKYKDNNAESYEDTELGSWLGTIKEILDDPQPDAMDFLDSIKAQSLLVRNSTLHPQR